MVLNQEIVRMGGRGYGDGLNAGMVIGLPPVMNFGQEPLRTKVLDEVFSGQKVCHLLLTMNGQDVEADDLGHFARYL
jgi:hypothetical protein